VTTAKLATWLIVGLTVVSLLMGIVQWLAVPEVSGAGARDLAPALKSTGHLRWAAVIERATQIPGLGSIDYFWQFVVNAPRNWVLRRTGIGPGPNIRVWESTTWEPTGWSYPIQNSLVLVLATVVIYSPVLVGAAFVVTNWRRRGHAPATAH
jgi:hypothetical protein